MQPDDLNDTDDLIDLAKQCAARIEALQTESHRLGVARARAIAALYAQDHSYRTLAQLVGLSTPRVAQLVTSVGPDITAAFRAWHLVGQHLNAIAPTVDDAINTLCDSPGFDRATLADLDALHAQYRQLLHGEADATAEQAKTFAETAQYLEATLLIWRRGNPPKKGARR